VRLRQWPCREGLKLNFEKSEVETVTVSKGLKIWEKWSWDNDHLERVSKFWKIVRLRPWPCREGLKMKFWKKMRLKPWPCQEGLKIWKKVKFRPWPCREGRKCGKKWGWDYNLVERVSKLNFKKVRLRPWACWEGLKIWKKWRLRAWPCQEGLIIKFWKK